MTMREKIARAIKSEIGKQFSARPLLGDTSSGDWYATGGSLDLMNVATAVLEALKEPTPEMLKHEDVAASWEWGHLCHYCGGPKYHWNIMIDAAINEGK